MLGSSLLAPSGLITLIVVATAAAISADPSADDVPSSRASEDSVEPQPQAQSKRFGPGYCGYGCGGCDCGMHGMHYGGFGGWGHFKRMADLNKRCAPSSMAGHHMGHMGSGHMGHMGGMGMGGCCHPCCLCCHGKLLAARSTSRNHGSIFGTLRFRRMCLAPPHSPITATTRMFGCGCHCPHAFRHPAYGGYGGLPWKRNADVWKRFYGYDLGLCYPPLPPPPARK